MKSQHGGFVDAHAHVFRPSSVSPREVSDLVPPERDAPVEDLLTVMSDANVSHAVLVPLDGSDDYVSSVVSRYPERFVGVAVATAVEHGLTSRDSVEALNERRRNYPFVALRTSWVGAPDQPIDASPMLSTLQWMAAENVVLWSYLGPEQFPLLAQALERVPGLRVVLNHFGFTPHNMRVDQARRPSFDVGLPAGLVDRIAALSRYPDVYLMVSGQYALSSQEPPYADLHEPTRKLAAAFGTGRLLWGSDYPWIRDAPGYRQTRDAIAEALPGLSADDIGKIYGGTVRSLFSFSPV
jgi:L-fuconolactonase